MSQYKRAKGRKPLHDPTWSRHKRIDINLRQGELDDLYEIAEKWEVKPAVVAWLIIAETLAHARGRCICELPNSEHIVDALQRAGITNNILGAEPDAPDPEQSG